MMIPTIIFFNNALVDSLEINTTQDTGTEPVLTESRVLSSLGPRDTKLIRYINHLDYLNQDLEEEPAWIISRVMEHKVVKKGSSESIPTTWVRVEWLVGGITWVQLDTVRRDQPFALVDYAASLPRPMLSTCAWRWTKDYLDNTDELTKLCQAFKASISSGPKIKFGVEVPRSVKHALWLDQKHGNTMWRDAIDKELKQINDYKTFRKLRAGESLDEYQRIPYHVVFDVKFDLRRKARLVAGGNVTTAEKEDTYSGVVGMADSIRLGFTLAEINGLMVCAADIGNAYLYGKTKEKVYVIGGIEFGKNEGEAMIIDKGLYGMQSSGARFHEHLSIRLRGMGYTPSKADPELWMKPVKDRYEYITRFVDDVLAFGKDPLATIEELKRDYILKGVGAPEYYLGGNIEELEPTWHDEGVKTALSAKTYVENVVRKYEELFGNENGFRQFRSPMDSTYHAESDDSPFLDAKNHSVFRALIGSANWAITLGRFDIAFATNCLARFSMQPREGHLKAAIRIFGYLKKFSKGRIIMDSAYPDHSKYPTEDYDWSELYPDATEELPPDMPEPLGKVVRMTVFVDADHAHDVVTRRSVTGVLLLINNTPVWWLSKRQRTVETSTYGSELVAARTAVELVMETRYTLRMLGVPLEGPALMLGDNMSVVLNTTLPSSKLTKKHQAIAYHRVRECVAGKIIRFTHIPSKENIADVLTKPLPNNDFQNLVSPVLFRKKKGTRENSQDGNSNKDEKEKPSTPILDIKGSNGKNPS